jgi:cystathionine beta-lyase/cystathionine gamma-synthase
MASPYNVTPLQLGADVVIHSTSKYLSGHNSHGGGVVLTTSSDWHKRLRTDQTTYDNHLSSAEFTSLHEGLISFPYRMPRFNANGQALAALLRSHPAVEKVYYGNQGRPEWLKGLGSVVSCELKNASLSKLETFYNQPLRGLIKAPSLGSNQTLFCPYVLLAYYDKSEEYLRDCNLSKYLLRFATGCEENFDTVLSSVSNALDALI